ncbi:MAG TPA: TVP38/TMEM64 family protein [Mycobacterium sp.]|nr:TVP38/TMEM64 family protein [Mycobacterium sp.]
MRDDLRSLWCALAASARQVPRWRIVVTVAAIVILVAIATFAPVPSAIQVRDWATSAGAWVPLVFLAAHVAVTVFPFPRTAFTLAAGLLFGTALGVVLAVVASTLSAVIALWLVRVSAWRLDRLISHPRVAAVDARLRRRGWPVVFSLRLIPAVPFSVINYLAGASTVRVVPYTLATFIGLAPGTLAVVVFGDAFTGHVNPWLIVVSVVTACVGFAGLVYEYRSGARSPERSSSASASATSE